MEQFCAGLFVVLGVCLVLPKAAILHWLWLKETPTNLTMKTHLNWLLFDGAISGSGRWYLRFSLGSVGKSRKKIK